MSALGPLQIALVARLKGDAGVSALVGAKVFDSYAPDGTAPPWLTIDSPTGLEEGSTLGPLGYGHTITVHAFDSDQEGNKGVTELSTAIKAALRQPLTVAGFSATRLRLEFETVLVEPNKRHANMRFRTMALETG